MESKGLDVFDLTIVWSWCASHGGAAIVLFPVACDLITNFSFQSLLTFSLPINFEKFDWNIAIWSTKVIFYVNFWRQTKVWMETKTPWMVERILKIPPIRRCVRRHQFCICWTATTMLLVFHDHEYLSESHLSHTVCNCSGGRCQYKAVLSSLTNAGRLLRKQMHTIRTHWESLLLFSISFKCLPIANFVKE